MKHIIFVSTLFALILSACGNAPAVAPTAAPVTVSLPVIQVDTQHMTTPNLAYEIPAGPGFVLDASNYDFGTASGPSVVQVVMNSRAYQGTWASGEKLQAVRAADLTPIAGAKPISNFDSGQQLIVAIGTLSANGRFAPIWVGVVNVK